MSETTSSHRKQTYNPRRYWSPRQLHQGFDFGDGDGDSDGDGIGDGKFDGDGDGDGVMSFERIVLVESVDTVLNQEEPGNTAVSSAQYS